MRFAPVVPARFQQLEMTEVKYRGAVLHILIKGNGIKLRQLKLDGQVLPAPFLEASTNGRHEIEIMME